MASFNIGDVICNIEYPTLTMQVVYARHGVIVARAVQHNRIVNKTMHVSDARKVTTLTCEELVQWLEYDFL